MSEVLPQQATKPRKTVAVIIPYYNGSDFIRRSAESVLSQTRKADEFVVVNDGSSPEEARRLHEIANEMGFTVLDKENGGQGSARNFGVANTTSDFLCFLDQDDFYLANHIEVLLKGMPRSDPHFGWVYGDLMEADGDGNIVRTSLAVHHSTHPKTDVFHLLRHDMFVLPSATLIAREAYEAVGGFDPQFMGYEDDDLFLRIFRAGFTNTFINKAVTVWCIHPDSTSYSIRMSRSRYRYFMKLCDMFPDDADRSRYFFRDLIALRFKNLFLADALNSIGTDRTKRNERLREHQGEIFQMLRGFYNRYAANRYVRRKDKFKLRLQIAVLSLKSPLIARLALLVRRRLQGRKPIPR